MDDIETQGMSYYMKEPNPILLESIILELTPIIVLCIYKVTSFYIIREDIIVRKDIEKY